jgi:hypothetical protein
MERYRLPQTGPQHDSVVAFNAAGTEQPGIFLPAWKTRHCWEPGFQQPAFTWPSISEVAVAVFQQPIWAIPLETSPDP